MRAILAAALSIMAVSPQAFADDYPVVVELFSSQGCAACPPADAMLADLAAREDVIALGLHVDYWDYIGWADSFASPRFTERQKAYAYAQGERMVYTPQFIVDGEHRVTGADGMAVMDAIRDGERRDSPVALRVMAADGAVTIAARSDVARDMVVHLVRYRPSAQVDIRRGENAGRTLDYANIVTSWSGDRALGWRRGAAPARRNGRQSSRCRPGATGRSRADLRGRPD